MGLPQTPAEATPVGRLVALFKEMGPYLDAFGRAYCGSLGGDATGRSGWPLDSEPVLSLVTYRYLDRFHSTPAKSEMDLARTIVIGGLWEGRKPSLGAEEGLPPVVRIILRMVEEEGDFVGSASEAEARIREFVREHAVPLSSSESLPDGPDALGIALSRSGVLLRDRGVELTRPQRRDVKRLWAWRKLTPSDDTPDAPDAGTCEGSGDVTAQAEGNSVDHDATDTYTPDDRRLMNAYYEGDEPHDRTAA